MDNDVLEEGRRLFQKLNFLFESTKVEELGLLVSTSGAPYLSGNEITDQFSNIFFLKNKNLGICYSCIPTLGSYTYAEFISHKDKIQEDCFPTLTQITRIIAMLNADNYTSWNTRKKLILVEKLDLEEELGFIDLILTKYPKSSETWEHRKWVLEQILNKNYKNPGYTVEEVKNQNLGLLKKTIKTCSISCERYPRNYYGWKHHQWVVEIFANTYLNEVVSLEMDLSYQWILKNISDYSGFCHRQRIVTLFMKLKEPTEIIQWFKLDFELNSRQISLHPGHESIWCYRRFLLNCYFHKILPFKESSSDGIIVDLNKEQVFVDNVVSCSKGEEVSGTIVKERLLANHTMALAYLEYTKRIVIKPPNK